MPSPSVAASTTQARAAWTGPDATPARAGTAIAGAFEGVRNTQRANVPTFEPTPGWTPAANLKSDPTKAIETAVAWRALSDEQKFEIGKEAFAISRGSTRNALNRNVDFWGNWKRAVRGHEAEYRAEQAAAKQSSPKPLGQVLDDYRAGNPGPIVVGQLLAYVKAEGIRNVAGLKVMLEGPACSRVQMTPAAGACNLAAEPPLAPRATKRHADFGGAIPGPSPMSGPSRTVNGFNAAIEWANLHPDHRKSQRMADFASANHCKEGAMRRWVDDEGRYTAAMESRRQSVKSGTRGGGNVNFGNGPEAAREWNRRVEGGAKPCSMEQFAQSLYGISGRALRRFVDPNGGFRPDMVPHLPPDHPYVLQHKAAATNAGTTQVQPVGCAARVEGGDLSDLTAEDWAAVEPEFTANGDLVADFGLTAEEQATLDAALFDAVRQVHGVLR